MTTQCPIVIVGAGVTGLSAAWHLLRDPKLPQNSSILIFEEMDTWGGCLQKTLANGYLLEWAAQGVLAKRSEFANLVKELQLEDEALSSSKKARTRYLISPQKDLVPIGPLPFFWIRSGLLSWTQYFRLFAEFFVRRPAASANESLYAFFARRFGEAAALRISVPMASGIWAGGSRSILVRAAFPVLVEWEKKFGSVTRGALKALWKVVSAKKKKIEPIRGLVTFPEGMKTLTDHLLQQCRALAEARGVIFEVRCGHKVTGIDFREEGVLVEFSNAGESSLERKREDSPELLSETPTESKVGGFSPTSLSPVSPLRASKLLWTCAPAENLRISGLDHLKAAWQGFAKKVNFHSVVVAGIGGKVPSHFRRAHGFGALAPSESADLLGVLNVHDINPTHVPDSHSVLYRVLLGGDRNPNFVDLPREQILETAKARLLELKLVPRDFVAEFQEIKVWKKAIALQDEVWALSVAELESAEKSSQGKLFFAGNYLEGVGVEDCLRSARRAAVRILQNLAAPFSL